MDIEELDDDPYEQIFFKEVVQHCDHAKVKLWLLDAAIQQYTSIKVFRKKKKYLPDEVFCRPGMPEPAMVAYMVIRGAHTDCIKYAQRKYREDRKQGECPSVDSGLDADDQCQPQIEPIVWSSLSLNTDSRTDSRISNFRSPLDRIKKIFGSHL